MRIPLTKYGWPQVVIYPAVILAVMAGVALGTTAVLPLWAIISIEVLLAAILIWILSFFRDPERSCPSDNSLLLAPADGQITDIERVEPPPAFLRKQEGPGRAALRLGIFLSIFDTHINRAPCNVKVEKITYKKGKYKNALAPESARVNESNELYLVRTDSPHDRLIVRQISGAIARRIVCDTTEGSELTGGEKFGMLKFGSRTELYVPLSENAKCMVKIGDKVKAGLTPLVKYVKREA
ncbi:MAG: phosphatidylserine decarboxylase family protein [Planctomycetes bacterium]|nr:phosphatidylserine decarboxylase family protein [Planctomycetota bacterium]MBL7142998.1 phosphatidylserine decarboxylase family protein [Phycisphaerae bacterium]